ncbi:MAG: division/cell wall cluster transcriptional repressor MraZ [Chloroflexota bacterium]
MMFLGEYAHTIDTKGRLTIPSKFRDALSRGVVITRGFSKNLVAYPIQEWAALAEKIRSKPVSDQKMMNFRRRLFSGAADLTPDKQGRVLIPNNLRAFAQLENDVMIVGNFDFLEIWQADAWEAERGLIEGEDAAAMWDNLGI